MRIWKRLIVCLMIASCCFSFASCASANAGAVATVDEEEQKWREAGRAVPLPTMINVNGFCYYELDLETIQNLNLAVESCDGLTEIGKIDLDSVSCEYAEDGSRVLKLRRTILKNKNDYDAHGTGAVIDETVYAYPDSQYPNLLVAILDGEPGIFEIGSVVGNRKVSAKALIQENHGLDDAQKIREVCICCFQAPQAGIEETVISDRAELESLYDAVNMISSTGNKRNLSGELDSYPFYECRIELENGFPLTLTYSPSDHLLTCDGVSFESNDALSAWITAHGEK